MNKDHRWIARNFGALIDQYGGRCVAIVGRKVVAVGSCTDRVERLARKTTGAAIPSVLRVPTKGSLGYPSVRLFGFS
jgi:hypothetical protein